MADVQEALLDYIEARLVADIGLTTDMGGTVRIALGFAKPDTPFPYLVHRITSVPDDSEVHPLRRGTYFIDIFTDSPVAASLMAIRQEIVESLDELEFNTAGNEATRARFTLDTEALIPETEDGIWHYAIVFNLRFFRDAEIAAINSR